MCPIFQEDKEKDNARIKFRCDTGSSTRVASSPVSSPVRWVMKLRNKCFQSQYLGSLYKISSTADV